MDQNTKKIILLSGIAALSVIPSMAQAAATSAGDTALLVTVDGSSASFIANTATFSISANVSAAWNQTSTAFAVSTANSKGMHSFGAASGSTSVLTCESTSFKNPTPRSATASDTGTGCS